MSQVPSLLLVEDDPDDAELLAQALRRSSDFACDVVRTGSLGEALEAIIGKAPDAVLLDLNLPDSDGLHTVQRIVEQAGGCPVIVLTGQDEMDLGVSAIRAGAHDFLNKSALQGDQVPRMVRHALERAKRFEAQASARARETRERELSAISRLTSSDAAAVTARLFEAGPIAEQNPGEFRNLLARYLALLQAAFADGDGRTAEPSAHELRVFVDRVGMQKGRAVDIVAVHLGALRELTRDEPEERAEAITAEARYILLDAIGHLADYYRRYSIRPQGIRFEGVSMTLGGKGTGSGR